MVCEIAFSSKPFRAGLRSAIDLIDLTFEKSARMESTEGGKGKGDTNVTNITEFMLSPFVVELQLLTECSRYRDEENCAVWGKAQPHPK